MAGAAGDDEAAVVADAGNRPDVAVGDAEVAVVAAGCDAITEADPLTKAGDGLTISLTSVVAAVADGCVDGSDLLAGVGDDQLVTGCADVGECVGALDLAGVDDDLVARSKSVEDLTGTLTFAHEQAEVGVRRVGEAVHRLELEVRLGPHPPCGEVEYPAAADGGQLVTVPEQRDGRVGSVGDREQRAGGVLVEHAGLVDQEYVAGQQPCAGVGTGVDLRTSVRPRPTGTRAGG